MLLQVRLMHKMRVVMLWWHLLWKMNVLRGAVEVSRTVLIDPQRVREGVVARVVVEDGRHLPHRVPGHPVEEVGSVFAPGPEFSPALVEQLHRKVRLESTRGAGSGHHRGRAPQRGLGHRERAWSSGGPRCSWSSWHLRNCHLERRDWRNRVGKRRFSDRR